MPLNITANLFFWDAAALIAMAIMLAHLVFWGTRKGPVPVLFRGPVNGE